MVCSRRPEGGEQTRQSAFLLDTSLVKLQKKRCQQKPTQEAMLSLPGQMGPSQPADASRAPAQVGWLVLALAEEPLSPGESSMPAATSCKESWDRVLPFPPQGSRAAGSPRRCLRGQLRAFQSLSWRAAEAEGPKAHQWDGSRGGALRGSSVATVNSGAACQGKESDAKMPERSPLPTCCPQPPPRGYLGLSRLTLCSHRTHLLPAGPPQAGEGRGIRWCR